MSVYARLLRIERQLKRIKAQCAYCRLHPRWVTVAEPGDPVTPPKPCPKCGATSYSVIVIGTPRTPGDDPPEDAA